MYKIGTSIYGISVLDNRDNTNFMFMIPADMINFKESKKIDPDELMSAIFKVARIANELPKKTPIGLSESGGKIKSIKMFSVDCIDGIVFLKEEMNVPVP